MWTKREIAALALAYDRRLVGTLHGITSLATIFPTIEMGERTCTSLLERGLFRVSHEGKPAVYTVTELGVKEFLAAMKGA